MVSNSPSTGGFAKDVSWGVSVIGMNSNYNAMGSMNGYSNAWVNAVGFLELLAIIIW